MIAGWMERALAEARARGCSDAEVFVKEARGRQITLEPPGTPGADPLRQVSETREAGAALRLRDPDGRWGFAWIGFGESVEPAGLVGWALHSARLGPPDGPDAATRASASCEGNRDSSAGPGLVDPGCLAAPEAEIVRRLHDGMIEVARIGEGMVEVDRVALAEVAMTVHMATARGMHGSFDRTLAIHSVSLVPAGPEARAVVEERSSCRLADLDIVQCARVAVWRALPERRAVVLATSGDTGAEGAEIQLQTVRLVLSPRAAATLIATLAPWVLSGGLPPARRPCALTLFDDATVPGRPTSAPFDGIGRPAVRRLLVEGGRSVDAIAGTGGHVHRSSYRVLPAPGPAALVVSPGVRAAESGSAVGSGGVLLRAAIVEVAAGNTCVLRIRRGDWWHGERNLGPADGLVWEGSLGKLVAAIVETGIEMEWFQVGFAVGTPSMILDGLSPWRLETQSARQI